MANEPVATTDKPTVPGTSPGTITSAGAAKARVAAEVQDHHPHQLYCRCGHPLHPDHIEMHRGMKLERYSCPQRRWWNALWHPRAWMEPREGVPA